MHTIIVGNMEQLIMFVFIIPTVISEHVLLTISTLIINIVFHISGTHAHAQAQIIVQVTKYAVKIVLCTVDVLLKTRLAQVEQLTIFVLMIYSALRKENALERLPLLKESVIA
jgi:hypothetical protein